MDHKQQKYENPFKLYANWIATKSRVARLIIHGRGGTIKGIDIATISLAANEPIIIPEIVRVGYTFDGFEVPSGTGWTRYNVPEACTFRGDKHIYAKWLNIDYSIVYNSNNGLFRRTTISNVLIDQNVAIRKAHDLGYEKEGYKTNSYSKHERGMSATISDVETLTVRDIIERFDLNYEDEVIDLFTKWDNRELLIRFNKNAADATGVMNDQLAIYDGAIRVLNENNIPFCRGV